MNKFDYKLITPFKWFVLENFPFIEADFDALTNWQLFCKIGKEMNKIINSQNTVGIQMENVTNAFIELQNFVNYYFENLDVQEEINNKLDEMAESGQLTEIITNYIAKCIIVFNTVSDMKENENLIVGSKCKTLGFHTIGDLGNAYYEIKENLTSNGKNIIALDNGLFAELIIENDTINPQMFGAYGYKGNYDDTKNDSTQILRFTSKFAVDNNIKNIDYLGLNYNCSGNNIIGLEIKEVTKPAELNINGKNAVFYWDSTNADNFAFAFVGYLRESKWQNLNVRCLNQNYKGNIFTTHFDIENQNHYFSENAFSNININSWWNDGTCNKVFDFSKDNSSHDDLSIFEEITAHYYNKFFYTNNKESVQNSFNNCYTISYKEGTIDFEIDVENWAGHLNINNHQFILTENNCVLIKTKETNSYLKLPIFVNNCRLEARVQNFKFCELGGYDLYINSLRPLSSFQINDSYKYFDIKKFASLYLKNCYNMPPHILIEPNTSDSQSNISIEECSFYNNNFVTPMPLLYFEGFDNYQELKQDITKYFHNITIRNGFSSTKSKYFKNYSLSTNDFEKYTSYHKQIQEQYRSAYIPNGNIVIEDLKVHNKTAYKCSVTIADYDGTNIAFRQNILFNNGIANITETIKCVLPQNKIRTMIISLQDENGTALNDNTCIIEIGTRPIFFDDELEQTENKWINK